MWRLFKDSAEPYVPPKNPFQTFMLVLCVLSSFPLLQGRTGSRLLEQELGDTTVILWGLSLLIGSVMALIGLWMPVHRAIFALVLERTGLILVGGAALIYTVVVATQAPYWAEISYPLGLQVAYAAACFWRCVQINKALRWSLSVRMMPPVEGSHE